MKKILAIVLCIAFALIPVFSVSAASETPAGWTANKGYDLDVNGDPTNDVNLETLVQTEDGLVISQEWGYYGIKAWGGNGLNNGYFKNDKVKLDGFKIKFRFDVIAQPDGDKKDSWFGMSFLNNKEAGMHAQLNKDLAKGFYINYKPNYDAGDANNRGTNIALVMIDPNDATFPNQSTLATTMDNYPAMSIVGAMVEMRFEKQSDGKYLIYVKNGDTDKLLTQDWGQPKAVDLEGILGDDEAYLAIGLSNKMAQPQQVTIESIAGVSMKLEPTPAPTATPAPNETEGPAETEAPSDDLPATGQDYTWAIILGSLAVLLAGAGAIILINKSEKNA